MKNIIRIISLIFVVTAIGGCGKSQQHQKSTDFPKGMKTELGVTGPVRQAAEQQKQRAAERDGAGQTLGLWLAAVNGIVKSHEFPPVLLSAGFLPLLFRFLHSPLLSW